MYFEQLLKCDDPINTFLWTCTESNPSEHLAPLKQGIKFQIMRLKNQKSPGEDEIQGEIMKMLNDEKITNVHKLIVHIWEKEELPQSWSVAIINPTRYPIYKKYDSHICNNYSGIALLNMAYKILSYCILDRIKPLAVEILGDYQGGFRPNRSTTDQIFSVRQIIEVVGIQ